MSDRKLVSSILLLAGLLAIITLPSGIGQSLTTLVKTITTQIVVTDAVNSTVGSTRGLSTQIQMYTVSTPFVIDATHGMYGCIYKALRLPANQGDQISGQIRSSSEISFYVMSADDYRAWTSANSCTVPSSMFGREKVTSLLLDMVAPSTGDYELLFLNASSNTPASVSVNFVRVYEAVTSISLPVVSTFPATRTKTATSTLTQIRTVETAPILEQYGLLIAVLLVIVLAALAFQRRSRKETTAVALPAIPSPIARKFCGNCGAPLPLSAQFCDRCGTPDDESA